MAAILFMQLLPFILIALFTIGWTIYQYQKRFQKNNFYEKDINDYITEFKEHYLFADKEYQLVLYSLKKERNLHEIDLMFYGQRQKELDEVKSDAMKLLVTHRLEKGILKYDELRELVKKANEEKIKSLNKIQK